MKQKYILWQTLLRYYLNIILTMGNKQQQQKNTSFVPDQIWMREVKPPHKFLNKNLKKKKCFFYHNLKRS